MFEETQRRKKTKVGDEMIRTIEMTPKVLQEWIKELKSGKYEQITRYYHSLQKQNCYCALGVLRHVVFGIPLDIDINIQLSIPEKLTIETNWNRVVHNHMDFEEITRMNDTEGKTFKEIAEKLPELVGFN